MANDIRRTNKTPSTGSEAGNVSIVDYNLRVDGTFYPPFGTELTLNGGKADKPALRALVDGDGKVLSWYYYDPFTTQWHNLSIYAPDGVVTVGDITIDEDYLATIDPIFQVRLNNVLVSSDGAPNNTIQLDSPDPLSRKDIICVSSDGSYVKVTGIPSASPNQPDTPDGTILIATVFIEMGELPSIDIQPVGGFYEKTGGLISGTVIIGGGEDIRLKPRFGTRDTGDFIFENPDGSVAARISYGGDDGEFIGLSFDEGETFQLIHTGNIVDKVIDDDNISTSTTYSSSKIEERLGTKANSEDIKSILSIKKTELTGNTYTNLEWANQVVSIYYYDDNGLQKESNLIFSDEGVLTIPFVGEDANWTFDIFGVMGAINRTIPMYFEVDDNMRLIAHTDEDFSAGTFSLSNNNHLILTI